MDYSSSVNLGENGESHLRKQCNLKFHDDLLISCVGNIVLEIFPRDVSLNLVNILFRKIPLMLFMVMKYFKISINA